MNTITVSTIITAPLTVVWEGWTLPEHIMNWNFASADWECPFVENGLRIGGRFTMRMSAKDGSVGFDFCGTYTEVVLCSLISYVMDDGRTVRVEFSEHEGRTTIIETFDPETENTLELQRAGWQAILNNFQTYIEAKSV